MKPKTIHACFVFIASLGQYTLMIYFDKHPCVNKVSSDIN